MTKLETLEQDIDDNLHKMAVTVLGPAAAALQGERTTTQNDEGSIEERISRAQAEKLLEEWKKIKLRAEKSGKYANSEDALLKDDDRKLRDELFIKTGEDD